MEVLGREERTAVYEDVLEADVEGCVGVGGERHARFASNVFWVAVFVAYCVFDLFVVSTLASCLQISKHASNWLLSRIPPSPHSYIQPSPFLPTLSSILTTSTSSRPSQFPEHEQQKKPTCMLRLCPSPLAPSEVTVTTTSVSLPTKFRIHRSLLTCAVAAAISNLSAVHSCTTVRKTTIWKRRLGSRSDESSIAATAR